MFLFPKTKIDDIKPCRYTEVDISTGNKSIFFRLEKIKVMQHSLPFMALNKGTVCCRWVTDPPNYMLLGPMVGTMNGDEAPIGILSTPNDNSITLIEYEEYIHFLYRFLENPEQFFLIADSYEELEEKIFSKWISNDIDTTF